MHLDPLLPSMVTVILVLLAVSIVLRALHQPSLVAYLLAGVALGPSGFALVTDTETISHLGALGVILLLFFVGMEASPGRLARNWRIAVIGTLLQIVVSVGAVWVLGQFIGLAIGPTVLLGFVISLSSTAVVLKLLQQTGELETEVGQNVLGVLLMQDLALVPMLIVVGLLSGVATDPVTLALQIGGGTLLVLVAAWVVMKGRVRLPFARQIQNDHELQVFAAAAACFGLAFITGLMGLSTALGAFLGGILVAAARETDWIQKSLDPFRVVLVAFFFVSIGMLIDLSFLREHWLEACALLVLVLLTNTLINALILRSLSGDWASALYASVLLSQIGEFSFVLAAVGLNVGLIGEFSYQMTVSVIALSLLVSPAWIALFRRGLRGRYALAPPEQKLSIPGDNVEQE